MKDCFTANNPVKEFLQGDEVQEYNCAPCSTETGMSRERLGKKVLPQDMDGSMKHRNFFVNTATFSPGSRPGSKIFSQRKNGSLLIIPPGRIAQFI